MKMLSWLAGIIFTLYSMVYLTKGSGVSLDITPNVTSENTRNLTAICKPATSGDWTNITYITIFRFANRSWHQHLVTMAGGEEPHLGPYLDETKYAVNGSSLQDPNITFVEVVINKPDRDDFIKDNTILSLGCKIIGINASDVVIDPVVPKQLNYTGDPNTGHITVSSSNSLLLIVTLAIIGQSVL